VVSSFVAAGVDCRLKVKGQEGKFDVAIAGRLAQVAGLDLEVRPKAELPPERTEDLERSLRLAMLWQAGHMWRENHKTFRLAEERHVDGGVLNVMGQHGELVFTPFLNPGLIRAAYALRASGQVFVA